MKLRQTVNIQLKKNKLNFCNDLLVYEAHSSLYIRSTNEYWLKDEYEEKKSLYNVYICNDKGLPDRTIVPG